MEGKLLQSLFTPPSLPVWWSQSCSCLSTHSNSPHCLIFLHWYIFFPPPSSALCLVSSPEASQVLGEQAEMHKSPEWLFVEPGSNKCSCGKILHPWRLRYDWCKYMRLAHVFVYISQLGFLMLVLAPQHCRFFSPSVPASHSLSAC